MKISDWWYKKCKSNKVCEWIDDYILWYVYSKPKSAYYSVRGWFRSNFNKYHWRLVKQAFLSNPWDGFYLLELEELQIDKQIHWFDHHQNMIDEQYNEIVRSLRWAKHCIHIMNNETDYFHFDGGVEDGETKPVGDNSKFALREIKLDNLVYRYDGPYLNKRNAKRFLNNSVLESDFFKNGNYDHEYYIAKARHLYYKIREKYTDYWWD